MNNKRLIMKDGTKKIITKKSFKELFQEKNIVRLCGASNALISMLAEEAGFEGVWLSSFEAHAACRLPDSNILSIGEYCDIINKIVDRISIPLLVDGDCGGGSPINTIRMIREFEKNGASGFCIEDNKYPKKCSFYSKKEDSLETAKFHASKIRAACDNRIDESFLIIARTEALIVGNSVNEAIDRANMYVDAGADAILIHHKGETADKIFEFSSLFDRDVPLVCVPTTYNSVKEDELIKNKYRMVIYANCAIRGTVKILQEIFKTILEEKSFSSVNNKIASLQEIFRLVAVNELYENEKKYLQ